MVEHPSDEQDNAARPRQPYEPPRLVVYGDIATLTRAVGNTGAKDQGNPPRHKTQV